MTNQLTVFDMVNQQEAFFNNVNESQLVTWAKESQFAIQALQKNTFTQSTAMNNPTSLQNAIINVASIGISLNPANKHAYLVPRDGQICLDISYMGLKHLAESSGAIEWIQAKIVYANDNYVNNGVDKAPTHNQQTFGQKGDVVGAYCTVKLPNGDYLTEEMDVNALNAVKATSKSITGKGANYSPWNTFPEEMMRKTVVKRAAKYWPSPKGELSTVNKAINVINEHEGLEQEPIFTEAEQKSFMQLIKDDLAFSLAAFMADCDDEKAIALFSSFPKGEISSNKKKVRELQAMGFQEWQDFTQTIKELIELKDVAGIEENIEGFELYEKRMLANQLGEPDTTILKELLTNG